MATDESETSTVNGELIIGGSLAHGALNCVIVLTQFPDDWFMKQFFSLDEVMRYAEENCLIVKEPKSE